MARALGDEAKQKQEIKPITNPAETNFMQEKKTRECKRDSTYVNMQQKPKKKNKKILSFLQVLLTTQQG
jgi:hypothetical protein